MKMYKAHREALMKKLPDGLITMGGGEESARNNDVYHVFRQRSHFLWLTGIEEPGCLVLLDPKKRKTTVFIPKVDDHYRVWEGHVPSPAEAKKLYGVDEVRYADEFAAALKKAANGYKRCYAFPSAVAKARRAFKPLANNQGSLRDALDALRAVKNEDEIAVLKEANRISAEGHKAAMRAAKPGMYEYEVQAEFEREVRRRGLKHLAYPSIVATGRNGAVLHYRQNDARLNKGDLLLIDAGGELRGYAADITRTFPVSGKFTPRQRDVYEIVLRAQKEAIDGARAGVLSGDWHRASMVTIGDGLKALKLLKGDVKDLVDGGAVRLFYPHGLGHMLGIDVHDTLGGKDRQVKPAKGVKMRFNAYFEPGFVVTAEPGIYFIEALLKNPELRKKYRAKIDFKRAEEYLPLGGIRIEDDVVVRYGGPPLNLTTVPKEIDEVEALCRG